MNIRHLNMGQVVAMLKQLGLPVIPARVYRAKKKWTKVTAQANIDALQAALAAKSL